MADYPRREWNGETFVWDQGPLGMSAALPDPNEGIDLDSIRQHQPILVQEGWWWHNCNAGKVHDHPEHPGRNWSEPMHRMCVPIYTTRTVRP